MGDHGMTENGDHGGDSNLELETALVFYSKKDFPNNTQQHDLKVKIKVSNQSYKKCKTFNS